MILTFNEKKALLQLKMSGGMISATGRKSKRAMAIISRLDAKGLVELEKDYLDSAPLTEAGLAYLEEK